MGANGCVTAWLVILEAVIRPVESQSKHCFSQISVFADKSIELRLEADSSSALYRVHEG